MATKTIDVTKDLRVAEFIRGLSPVRQPIQIVLGGRAVARLVPVDELTEVEKENILQEGWMAVEQARARNKGRAEREIGKAVDAAVHRVRADQ
jgi:antitoxin (DNA-binding transcriptional repressor) of toxin-antitoxin stability system